MSLIAWQPLTELELVHSGRTESIFSKKENVTRIPPIELQETDTDIILKAQVPGMNAKNLDVQVSAIAVSIAGKHQQEEHTENKGFFYSEFSYGLFQRIVPLPVSVKHDQVKAEFNDGLLTLILPKAEELGSNVVKVDLTMQDKAREAMDRWLNSANI